MSGSILRLLMAWSRKFGIGALAALAAIIVMIVPATMAHAAVNPPGAVPPSAGQPSAPLSSPSDCASLPNDNGRPLCFWVDAGWVGTMGYYYGTGYHWDAWSASQCATGGKNGANWAKCASALDNNSSTNYAVVWKGDNLTGTKRCLSPGTQLNNLVHDDFNDGSVMNDAIESNSWSSVDC